MITLVSTTPAVFAEEQVTIVTVEGSGFGQDCAESNGGSGCYTPMEATVNVGEKVTMINSDPTGAAHTFTSGTVDGFSPSPDGTFDSLILAQDESYEWSPDTAGNVPYYCLLHTWMVGTIIVQEAGAEEETHEEKMMKETPKEETHTEKELMKMEKMMIGDVDVTMSPPFEGSSDASVTIIEFGDYQCPKCDQWFQNEKPTITSDYIDTGKVNLYFVDFPFLGEDSDNAANASYCANDQGQFWEYHSMLYNNQGGINEGWANVNALKQFAADLGLDTAEFNSCVDSNKYEDRVDYNRKVGASHGVEGTPVFIIIGSDGTTQRIDGPQSSDIFAGVIDTLLDEPVEEAMAQETTMELPEGAVEGIEVGNTALWVEISGDKVYVSNPEDGIIHVIDANTNEVIDTIQSMVGVTVLEVVEDKNKLYASVLEHAPVQVYDLTTGESLGEIDIGEPIITQWSKSDKNYGQREYINIQTNAIGLKYNPNTELLYAAHSTVNHVNIIDTKTDQDLGDIPVGKTPLMIEIDQERNIGYVTNWETNDVSVLDLESNEQIKTLNTGFVPDQMEIDYDNNRLYVTHHGSPHVSVIDIRTQEIEGKIALDGPTHALALDTINHILHVTYLPDSGVTGQGLPGKVEFIDTSSNQIVGGFSIPDNPFTIDIDSENQKLYASIVNNGVIFIVDLNEDPNYQEILVQSEETIAESESPGGGGCLIATASYGTELAPQVQFLREIRDNTVMSTESGAAFMTGFNQLYYSFSPTIADLEREHPLFQETVRVIITPMISTLSIMTLAENGNDAEVLGLGISVIALNLGMYIAIPVAVGFAVSKRIRK